MVVCQVCHKENPVGAEYCENCGAALPVGAPAGQTAPPGLSAGPSEPLLPDGSASPQPSPASPSDAVSSAPPAGSTVGSGTAERAPATPPAEAVTPVAANGNGSARLIALRYGAPTGEEIPLLGQRLAIGRFDPETGPVDIDLSGTSEANHISRQHGELSRDPEGRWTVRDLGSANGIFVKGGGDPSFGPGINAPRPLANGDEIAFGNARFVFRTD